jgi:hypothetical protein
VTGSKPERINVDALVSLEAPRDRLEVLSDWLKYMYIAQVHAEDITSPLALKSTNI